ncbi:PREDICTED: uncharacterized protein LOC106743117, partial [Dinoponera quadriceps]
MVVTSWNLFLDNDNEEEFKREYKRAYKNPFEGLSFSFTCEGRPVGFYADVEHDCKIFHVCNEHGERIPVFCPYKTLFDQRQRMCTDEEIPCKQSEKWYYLDSSNY